MHMVTPLRLPGFERVPWTADGEAAAALARLQTIFRTEEFVGVIAAGFRLAGTSTVWTAAGGYADVDSRVPLSPQRQMLAGSITKLVTAVVALRLVAEELVELDSPANRHLSSLRLESDAATVRQLLTHTAGVTSSFQHFVDAVPPTAAVLGTSVGVEFRPGSDHRYSNGGYAVLGELISHVRGLTYAEVVESEIFDPLGMKASAILTHWPDDAPCGYVVRDGAAVVTDRKVPSVQAAGGLYTTVGDLGRFLAGWATLIPEGLAVDATSHQVELGGDRWQGYGWRISRADGLTVAGHGGGVLGFRASLLWDMAGERASVVLVNSENDQTETLNRNLLSMT